MMFYMKISGKGCLAFFAVDDEVQKPINPVAEP